MYQKVTYVYISCQIMLPSLSPGCAPVTSTRVPVFDRFPRFPTPDFPARGLTTRKKCAKFAPSKRLRGRHAARRDSQREGRLVQGFWIATGIDTTSEPQSGNALPGAPVIASMSGGLRPQPGWNRGILLYPTPDLFRGWVIFLPSPKADTRYRDTRSPCFRLRIYISSI